MRYRFEVAPKYTKTYKTVENLDKALEKYKVAEDRSLREVHHILTYTADGRVTAVFYGSTIEANCAFHAGFAWVN